VEKLIEELVNEVRRIRRLIEEFVKIYKEDYEKVEEEIK